MSAVDNLTPSATAVENRKSQPQQSNSVKFSDVLSIALRFWYWVVISVIVCLGIAVLVVKMTTPIYTRSCSVIIRDDAASSAGASSVDLSEIGIGMSNTILEDEMAALKSPDLMEQVVSKLGLQVSYSTPGTFHDQVLYGSNLPLTVSFPDMPEDESASLTINVTPEGRVEIENMTVNKRHYVLPGNAPIKFGATIGTPSGRIIIKKTPFFKEGKEYIIKVKRMTLRAATEAYEYTINVSQLNKLSNVVLITCEDASIQRADEILTSLVNAYNQDWIKSRAQVVAVTSNFITDRLNSLERELGSVDSDIAGYKSTNMIPDLSAVSAIAMQQSNTASSEIVTLNNELQMARYLRNYISSEAKNTVLPAASGIGSATTESLIAQYNQMMMQRNSTLSNTSESNPIIMDLDSRLATIRASILSSLDNQILSLTTTISNLERSEQTANARVAANPRQAQFLLTAERQQKVKETLYLYLLQKREENELSQAFTSVNTRILRQPSGIPVPTSPKKSQIYLIGLVIGLAIPIGIIYIMELSNTKVRGKKDLENVSIPIIGEIPLYRRIQQKAGLLKRFNPTKQREAMNSSDDILVKEGSRNLVNEAFRVLRTNINFITGDMLPCVTMITSFNPGSGKTFICINLGIALALKGKRVLLIDGDMRRASLSEYVDSPRKGLSDYLTGNVREISNVIVSDTIHEGLSVLPVGHIPPNPTELLETKRFSNLIEYLRGEYDYIFIDCPPIQMMADASIINTVCDRTFFVARVALFERSMLPELERMYQTKQFHNMSMILNGSQTGSRYGYAYRYGYGYSKANYNYRYKRPEE